MIKINLLANMPAESRPFRFPAITMPKINMMKLLRVVMLGTAAALLICVFGKFVAAVLAIVFVFWVLNQLM